MSDRTADELTAGMTYRDDLGRYLEVRTAQKCGSFVVVTTNGGRFVLKRESKVNIVDPVRGLILRGRG